MASARLRPGVRRPLKRIPRTVREPPSQMVIIFWLLRPAKITLGLVHPAARITVGLVMNRPSSNTQRLSFSTISSTSSLLSAAGVYQEAPRPSVRLSKAGSGVVCTASTRLRSHTVPIGGRVRSKSFPVVNSMLLQASNTLSSTMVFFTCIYLLGRELGTPYIRARAEKKRSPARPSMIFPRTTWSSPTMRMPPVLRTP